MSDHQSIEDAESEYRNGLIATMTAFVMWGLYPFYWHALASVSSLEVAAHRIVWCAIFVCTYLCWRFGLDWLRLLRTRPRAFAGLLLSSVLISINWLLYIWAVKHDRVVDVSLGYFVSPLVSVALGVLVLSERLEKVQWAAVLIAMAGVGYMTLQSGQLPWISMTLALSFAAYGLIRKRISVDAVPGMGIESLLMSVPAMLYLLYLEAVGSGDFLRVGLKQDSLLVIAGLVTALPLICYAYGARRLPLSTVGFMQYLAPTLQLLIGVLVFGEAFGFDRAVGFSLIWFALVVYMVHGLRGFRARRKLHRDMA